MPLPPTAPDPTPTPIDDVGRILALLARARGLATALALSAPPGASPAGSADRSAADALLAARLAPDMFTLAEQAVVLADGLLGALALLAGADDHPAAAFVFNRGVGMDLGPLPVSGADLVARLAGVEAEAGALAAPARERPLAAEIRVARPGDIRLFPGADFVGRYVLPNGEFHLAMIYAIARSAGLPLGKRLYEGETIWRRPDAGDGRP